MEYRGFHFSELEGGIESSKIQQVLDQLQYMHNPKYQCCRADFERAFAVQPCLILSCTLSPAVSLLPYSISIKDGEMGSCCPKCHFTLFHFLWNRTNENKQTKITFSLTARLNRAKLLHVQYMETLWDSEGSQMKQHRGSWESWKGTCQWCYSVEALLIGWSSPLVIGSGMHPG